MEPLFKRSRSENGGYGSNPWIPEQQEHGSSFQQSNGGGDLECRRFNTPEGCSYGASCRFRHVSADGRDVGQQGMSSSGGKPKPCMKFFSTSGCPFGESCHFLHYVPGGLSSLGLGPVISSVSATSAATSHRKLAPPAGDPSVTVNGFKTKLCNRFNTQEGCRFGDRCHFAHGESDLRSANNLSWGNNRAPMAEGPSGAAPHGFRNGPSDVSHSTLYANASNMNSQVYREPNPPGVARNEGPTSYPSGPVGENVQVY